MIRDAVIHVANEQPLLADLYEMPTTRDATLVCTNLRMLNGQRPVFIDAQDSVFVLPLVHVRFVEIPSRSIQAGALEGREASVSTAPPEAPDDESDHALDEEFLRRVREA